MNKEKFHIKAVYSTVLMATASALLLFSAPVYASTTDDRIESSARDSYIFKNYLNNDAIKITSKEGVVTLTGNVTEEPHKKLAAETVESLPGVKSVDNQLVLKDEKTAGNMDALVKERVKLEMLYHRNLSATKSEFQVKDGVVTVRGEAASKAQIDLTTEYIKDVDGVKDVKNEMVVANAGKTVTEKVEDVGTLIDDASITALVKATLLYHRSTSALNTKVETVDGMVKLTGTAKNAAEVNLATKFVKDVHGVKSVVNNMVIEKKDPATK
ncbi:MAG: BON domain-containing protein [Desulfobulbus sp.]|nr:BON domain-containing protein [Desulfobulbus sp.]